MRINFHELREVAIPHLNGGDGMVSTKMFVELENKILLSRLAPGCSIGMHTHATSSEINYVLSGYGTAICDSEEESLEPGICHYCAKGQSHTIINNGTVELVMFTVVSEQ